MSTEPNAWCRVLGIDVPRVESVVGAPDANTYALFLVALLERGEAMTLAEVAARLARAGVDSEERVLLSLKRCKPGRPPAYRDGDRYHLDPHDDELGLWVFRLGLRPPRVVPAPAAPVPDTPLPGDDVPLSWNELDEAWNDSNLISWSAVRVAVAVLDAQRAPMRPSAVVAAATERTRWHRLRENAHGFGRRGHAIAVTEDGSWALDEGATAAIAATRRAVREQVSLARRAAGTRPSAASIEEAVAASERERAVHAAQLANLSRAILVAYPVERPEVVALLDVEEHTIASFARAGFEELRARLATYDVLGAVGIRALLRALELAPGDRRLAELEPPQKTVQIDRRGRTLKLTTELLVSGSCGIARPFGDGDALPRYLAAGDTKKLRWRLEADVKSLYALYQYGRLHGGVRLRLGFLDELIPAPWLYRDEPSLHHLKRSALTMGIGLEVVVGNAPGWADPWARARTVNVEADDTGWHTTLVDQAGMVVHEADVQAARLTATLH